MNNLKDTAIKYLSLGLSVIPTKKDKRPALPSWEEYQKKPLSEAEAAKLFSNQNIKAIAIICGKVSGNLEVIDIDLKYDNTGLVWDELQEYIENHLPEVFKKLVIAQTPSGGYHIYYRAENLQGNKKLAMRPPTAEEQKETYQKEIKKGAKEPQAKKASLASLVLIETRGTGGYVMAPPSEGYLYLDKGPEAIPTITQAERDILISICRSFNEVEEPKEEPEKTAHVNLNKRGNLSPWEDYDNRGPALELLERYGWSKVKTKGPRVFLKRPGDPDNKTSGNYHKDFKRLYVFSTSTVFDTDKAYGPAGIYTELEHNGDKQKAYKALLEAGYGTPYEPDKNRSRGTLKKEVKTEVITVTSVNKVNPVTQIITSPGDTLKIDQVETSEGDIIINSPGPEATAEVLKALSLLDKTTKRVYVKEGSEEPILDWRYRLEAILHKYEKIEAEAGDLTELQVQGLLDEVTATAGLIKGPLDRDQYIKAFTSLEAIQGLGITEESLRLTSDKLRIKRDEAERDNHFKGLLSEVNRLQDEGDISGAIKATDEGLKNIRAEAGRMLLPTPVTVDSISAKIADIPPTLSTGYSLLDEFIGITPGAITLIAGRPGHGKTTVLYNLLLEMHRAHRPEGYKFYFFTYEEPLTYLFIKILNRVIGRDLKEYFSQYTLPRPTNLEYLKKYIQSKRGDIEAIEDAKKQLDKALSGGEIVLIDKNYSVEDLYSLLGYLSKREKIGGVFIDYIQRLRTEHKTQDKRTEIAYISDQVLQIAKENNLPIILGAQLNRATVASKHKEPTLENLKEAGNLEEDANTVISIYNPDREEPDNGDNPAQAKTPAGYLKLKALKNRDGETNRSTKLEIDWRAGRLDNKPPKAKF